MNTEYIAKMISDELAGKIAAIHAYDNIIWKVRAGFLTLVFGAWGLVIKGAVEAKVELSQIKPFVVLLGVFSLMLSVGAFFIDRNYARRKFRVINAVNELVELTAQNELEEMPAESKLRLTSLLKISGDAANTSYKSKAFSNEIMVSYIIYLQSFLLVLAILIYHNKF